MRCCRVELQDRWADVTGVELRQGYGLTEAAPVCLFNRIDRPNVRGTLGVPFPGVDVAIMPPADYTERADSASAAHEVAPLADGVPGEICVRGENVFAGYVGGSDAGLPRRGEWLCTGDEGVRNADGTISFLGLLKPMFTRNGFNIYPREIERVVLALPGVHERRGRARSPSLPRRTTSGCASRARSPRTTSSAGARRGSAPTSSPPRSRSPTCDRAALASYAGCGTANVAVVVMAERGIIVKLPLFTPRTTASTTSGSNCVPRQRTISAIASSMDSPGR